MKRVYRGRVVGVEKVSSNAFGDKFYEIEFNGGKALYKRTSHQVMDVEPGDFIYFTCEHIKSKFTEFFLIIELYDSSHIDMLESEEEYKKLVCLTMGD